MDLLILQAGPGRAHGQEGKDSALRTTPSNKLAPAKRHFVFNFQGVDAWA
jgi:hypothetical protein